MYLIQKCALRLLACHFLQQCWICLFSVALVPKISSDFTQSQTASLQEWFLFTFSVKLLELLGDPLHGFSCDLGAKVPVKRGRSTTLHSRWTIFWSRPQLHLCVFAYVCVFVPAACVPGRSSCSQRLLCPLHCTAGRWSQWCSSHCSSHSCKTQTHLTASTHIELHDTHEWIQCINAVYKRARSYLSTKPLWMLVFIFSVKCSTLDWKIEHS